MNSKQIFWAEDVKWAGKPITSNRGNSPSFDFVKNGRIEHIWYIRNGNILTRLPMDVDEKEYHWILNSSQVTAFYRDWEKIKNG